MTNDIFHTKLPLSRHLYLYISGYDVYCPFTRVRGRLPPTKMQHIDTLNFDPPSPLYIPHLTSLDKLPDELIPSQLSRSNSCIFSVIQLPFLPDIQTLTFTLTLTLTFTFTFYHIDYLFPLLPSITPCNITSVYLDIYPFVTFTYALRLPITSNHCPNEQIEPTHYNYTVARWAVLYTYIVDIIITKYYVLTVSQ